MKKEKLGGREEGRAIERGGKERGRIANKQLLLVDLQLDGRFIAPSCKIQAPICMVPGFRTLTYHCNP